MYPLRHPYDAQCQSSTRRQAYRNGTPASLIYPNQTPPGTRTGGFFFFAAVRISCDLMVQNENEWGAPSELRIRRKLTAMEGGDRVDSDHSASAGRTSLTGSTSNSTWKTGEGCFRPGQYRAFVPSSLFWSSVMIKFATRTEWEIMIAR